MNNPFTVVTANRSSLIKPLADSDVLLPNERKYYGERQHWASVIQPVYETFVFLLAIIWAVDVTTGTGFSNPLVVTILVAAVAHAGFLFLTGGRAPISRVAVDPFANPAGRSVNRVTAASVALSLGLGAFLFGFRLTAIFAVIAVITRLVVLLARWTFYERRYITNRRLIEAGGFLGSRISSMPLSRVTDISYRRTVPGELLGYATMRVETAGQDQALGTVRFISSPDDFYEVLVNFSAPEPAASANELPTAEERKQRRELARRSRARRNRRILQFEEPELP